MGRWFLVYDRVERGRKPIGEEFVVCFVLDVGHTID